MYNSKAACDASINASYLLSNGCFDSLCEAKSGFRLHQIFWCGIKTQRGKELRTTNVQHRTSNMEALRDAAFARPGGCKSETVIIPGRCMLASPVRFFKTAEQSKSPAA